LRAAPSGRNRNVTRRGYDAGYRDRRTADCSLIGSSPGLNLLPAVQAPFAGRHRDFLLWVLALLRRSHPPPASSIPPAIIDPRPLLAGSPAACRAFITLAGRLGRAIPPPRPSARSRFSQGTFDRTHGNGRDAPMVAICRIVETGWCRPSRISPKAADPRARSAQSGLSWLRRRRQLRPEVIFAFRVLGSAGYGQTFAGVAVKIDPALAGVAACRWTVCACCRPRYSASLAAVRCMPSA